MSAASRPGEAGDAAAAPRPPAGGGALPPLSPSIAGRSIGPLVQPIDARWLMAYAAGLGETGARYFDTLAAGGPAAHPLFAVCYEWPAAVALRRAVIPDALAMLGVHATHHVVIHRPPRAGDALATTARVAGVEARRAGVLVTMEMSTVDAAGQPVTTTAYGSVYRGVALAGDPAAPAPLPTPAAPAPTGPGHASAARVPPAAADPATPLWAEPVEVAATAAHVYTECARIWNPIHTDAAVARAAGLPGLILHGTATLALAVSRVLRREAGADPARVREVAGRFTGMVSMPSTFTVRVLRRAPDRVLFDAVDAAGRPVLGEGVLCLSQR